MKVSLRHSLVFVKEDRLSRSAALGEQIKVVHLSNGLGSKIRKAGV